MNCTYEAVIASFYSICNSIHEASREWRGGAVSSSAVPQELMGRELPAAGKEVCSNSAGGSSFLTCRMDESDHFLSKDSLRLQKQRTFREYEREKCPGQVTNNTDSINNSSYVA